ncbi:vicilin-like seed storage protein At4g36700 isoform X3 [Carex rostrata]
MAKKKLILFALAVVFLCVWSVLGHHEVLVRKEERRVVSVCESGSISTVDVRDWTGGTSYHLQFITMEPNSLFLPVLLHSDMVFYVHSGKARINYMEVENSDSKNKKKESSDGSRSIDLKRGDVYRLEQGTTFYITSYPAPTRAKFRIYAIFNIANVDDPREQFFGAYSNISDLVRGFDERILQTGFGVSEELVQSIKWAERTPPIVPYVLRNESNKRSWKEGIIESVVGFPDQTEELNKKKKSKTRTFNFYSGKPDVKNCYGWSTAITHEELEALETIDIGAFMVNLTTGSMMGPHWNPKATEISIVTRGQGMVQIICPTNPVGQFTRHVKCQNSVYWVKEGDVFIVPKYHPMTQISFNNDSFVFVGFSTNARNNYPQFLAGERSVLKEIDREILKEAFSAPNSTVVEELLSSQRDAIILGCTSCAEDLTEKAAEEEHQRAEKERRREEKRREEEEAARKREEEEEQARREEQEEEARRREEERARREEQEEEERREEEEARRREEQKEEKRRREEEEAKRREEEQARREEEEEEREEEEEARRREEEEEEARRREEEEEEGEQWIRQKKEARPLGGWK